MVKLILKYQYLIFIAFILCFRLIYAANVVNFTQDQARDVVLMDRFRQEKVMFVDYGPKASVGNFYLAPFYYQLHYFISFFTNNHPLTMHYVTTFVESFTPFILLLVLIRFFDKKSSYVAATLFAFSPLVTIFATFAWNPNMIPFLSTLSLYLLLRYSEEKKWWQVAGGTLFVALAVHLHYQAVVLLPFLAFFYIYLGRSFRIWKHISLAILLAAATMLPYFVSEIANNWQNTRQIISFFTSEHSRYFDRVSKPEFIFTFIPQFFERIFYKESFGWMKVLIGRFVFLAGFFLFFIKAFRNKKIFLVLIYFVSILVMMRVYKGDKLDYYMSTLFIAPYFLIAMLLHFKKVFVGLVLLIAWFAGGQYARVTPKNQLNELMTAVSFINRNVVSNSANFIFHDDNYVNIFSYGLRKYSTLRHDPSSLAVVDICYGIQRCNWDGNLWCADDRGYTFMALFREAAIYTQEASFMTYDAFNLSVGRIEASTIPNYEVSLYDNAYGNDLLDLN